MNSTWEIKDFLEIKNNQLYMDGVSSVELAEKYDTPLFVFSESRIKHNINRLRQAQSVIDCTLKICYAAKANSNMAILQTIKNAGSDLEVNSGGELFKALKIGFAPEQIIFNGTSKTVSELTDAIDAGIYAIQADSLFEIELVDKVARQLKKRANVSLRIVPEIETGTHPGLKTAMNSSKFGMTVNDALTAFYRWKPNDEYLNLCGIHLHVGSQTPNPEPYLEAFGFLWAKLKQIHAETAHKLTHLNLGGGFPVNYLRDKSLAEFMPEMQQNLFASDFEPKAAIGQSWNLVKNLAHESNADYLLENLTILLEPGRSVIADAGICLTKARNRKERPIKHKNINKHDSDVWLLTDAGFNILLSMETYKWYYHLVSAQRAGEKHESPYKLAGPLCDGGDVYFDIEDQNRLPEYRLLPENVQPNEVLALLNCGAYSIAQMFQYNGRPLPAVILINENGEPKLIRRRDSYKDLLTNDIW
jgi:diaminopimelate decarboxylase